MADRSRRREEAEVFTEMPGLVFRLLTSAATLSFSLEEEHLVSDACLSAWSYGGRLHGMGDPEIVFSVSQEEDGGFVAECLSHDFFTQGNTWDDLRRNVREAINAYFFDQPKPGKVRLHFVRDEVFRTP